MAEALFARLVQSGPIPLDAEIACAPGELLALVGPSGSGKTTILKAIAGLYRPAGGAVRCGDAVWFDAEAGAWLRPQARRVGFVFQHYALFPTMTALQNIESSIPGGDPARRRTATSLLAQVHLEAKANRRPGQLSGGEQQRVALARALARAPDVLLLDEPFSAVDRMTRRKLQRDLAELRRELNIPIVLVTHDIEEARTLADRLVVLSGGRTLQAGSPAEVAANPATPEVAEILGLD